MSKASQHDDLGLNARISRRDFIYVSGATLAASLGAWGCSGPKDLFDLDLDDWYGPGGIGDYAPSHGNTPDVIRTAHALSRGQFDPLPTGSVDTGEHYDLVVVGGGFSGLSAAYHFNRLRSGGRCLIIDNHPIFGGEAKRNEFSVNGHRLFGPQGSNGAGIQRETGNPDDYFTGLGIPRDLEFAPIDPSIASIKFALDNYGFMHWKADQSTVGHFFAGSGGSDGRWAKNIWENDLAETPWPQSLRDEYLRWRRETPDAHSKGDLNTWLDSMTLKDYYEGVLSLPPEVTSYADPLLAGAIGLGCDAISAYWGRYFALPGFGRSYGSGQWLSFPGGNAGIARFFVKKLIPTAIRGNPSLNDIITKPVVFAELDKAAHNNRIRLSATVIGVEHRGGRDKSEHVVVTYVKANKVYKVTADRVVMASGGWVNRRILRDMPEEYAGAYSALSHSSVLVVNVALTNWRFLQRLGIAGCMWSGGFGFSCNIRRPMIFEDEQQPFHPDQPIVLTFYVPLYYPGQPAVQQGITGRQTLLTTPFKAYERMIREQMVTLFSQAGFDPAKDIAGIILNRWGHAYVNPGPEYMYAGDGRDTPRDILRRPFGRIAIGHSEFKGHQSWTGAADEGRRAVERILGESA